MPTSRTLLLSFLQLLGCVVVVLGWELIIRWSGTRLLPGPGPVAAAMWQLFIDGTLLKHVVASLFRVFWGFAIATLLGVPVGIWLGWSPLAEKAFGPLLQVLRPIGSLAWLPASILWFGVGDASALFVIFVACFGPLTVLTANAVRKISEVHVAAGRNFGLRGGRLIREVVLPAILPSVLRGARQTVFIAWVVVVMAEMVAVNSGLGFLVIDSRNAGNRYDVVLGAIVYIGLVGLLLDRLMAELEQVPSWVREQTATGQNQMRIERRRFRRPS